jgi:glycosyltransferase 2 family protein
MSGTHSTEMPMLGLIRKTIAFLREKHIFHKLGLVMSLTIIAIACYVLYDMLRDLDFGDLVDALKAKPARSIVMAMLFVAAGYFTLTFYDLFALRTIGRTEVPYRIAALAGFTSYSIGHNVGASALTGGAVRYRVYSAWGLNAVDVAKVCFIAGLTFWLGNAAVLGLGISYHPEAASEIDRLPVWLNQVVAVIILAALAAYVAWVWTAPRVVGRGQWSVTLPGGGLTLLQIVIGIVDLACCAMAMYMLVPDTPHIDFVTVAVIFVSATLLGFASHSPGGLGVFDAAMLVGLWHYDKAELLAGMLLFRVLYYITPFVLSLLLLAVREISLGGRVTAAAPVVEPSHMPPAASDVIAGSLDEADQTRSVVREERRA